jgi:hypothetical protein
MGDLNNIMHASEKLGPRPANDRTISKLCCLVKDRGFFFYFGYNRLHILGLTKDLARHLLMSISTDSWLTLNGAPSFLIRFLKTHHTQTHWPGLVGKIFGKMQL